MATKYVRADGTASWADATDESAASTSCAWSTVGTNPSAGDTVVVSGLGGVYRETLSFGAFDGTVGNEVTIQGSNSPVINGSDVITGFTVYSGSVYQATVTTEPEQIFMDGTRGDRQGSIGACVNEYDWFWASNVLYVYAPGDPDTEYTTVEGSARTNCIYSARDYVIIDGIECVKSNQIGIRNFGGIGVTIENCTVTDHYWHGIQSTDAGADQIIQDNTVSYCGVFGIQVKGTMDGAITRRNDVSYISVSSNQKYSLDANLRYSGGIEHYAQNNEHTLSSVYHNYVHDVGVAASTGNVVGIWCDGDNHATSPTHIYQNWVQDCAGAGIFCEISHNIHIFSNIIVDCAFRTSSTRDANILCNNWDTYTSADNVVYGNISIGGTNGLAVYCNNPSGAAQMTDCKFRNNIVVDATVRNLYCYNGGDNDGVWGSGNEYENNCFGAEAADFAYWDDTSYSTYDSLLSAMNASENIQSDTNVESDPIFTGGAGFSAYEIASNCPTKGMGTDLGSPYDTGLLPGSTWPSGVLTADRDNY